uniref:Secreted protein n=1 Tax=Helianthus annuus TaxID=4232 RepID=A0A251V0T3_HELAN
MWTHVFKPFLFLSFCPTTNTITPKKTLAPPLPRPVVAALFSFFLFAAETLPPLPSSSPATPPPLIQVNHKDWMCFGGC